MSYQRCYYYSCGFAAVESKTDRTGLFIKQTQLQARFRANPNSITTNRPIGCQKDDVSTPGCHFKDPLANLVIKDNFIPTELTQQ